ncbi:MAG: thioredoxin domain-containing protein [Planctomycetes bacterium]|nr:thioredoxin domain-containing protein [Planctomycetota bacterium]
MSKPNRLAAEASPYLQQHAHNPVDWFPWGEEAFARARAEDRPIFLSVGYATCHWCHVMERESFEDEHIAAFMNAHFVNVKVDREEQPDVDQIYMAAVQAMTGQGGWPMSVFLTPELEPFHAGTYYPPRSRWGRPGFDDLLQAVQRAWAETPERLRRQAGEVRRVIGAGQPEAATEGLPPRAAVATAISSMRRSFDPTWGGFGGAPKFPRSMTIQLLLREIGRRGDPDGSLMTMVRTTLERMWRGGMYDHVGGGFARYSTDEKWLVPHFEKMLYDNALLVRAYTEAWQVDHDEDWKRVVFETLDWVLAEMRHPRGGFFSAQDADSEGEEGRFYVWTRAQLDEVLGAEDGAFAARVFGVDQGPNFEGRSVLHLPEHPRELAAALGLERAEFEDRLRRVREALYRARSTRVHPLLDDKVLSSWNGLMIGAFAFAGAVFAEPRYLEAARTAADFVLEELRRDGELMRRWRGGQVGLEGSLEDHAFLAHGLIELFQALGQPAHLEAARALTETMIERFGDPEGGGFYFTEEDRPHLILRLKDGHDGATPSGNSLAVMNLLQLAALLDRPDWRALAEAALAAQAGALASYPMAHPLLLSALDDAHEGPTEALLILAGETEGELAAAWRRSHRPGAVTLVLREGEREALAALSPLVGDRRSPDGRESLWLCRAGVCERPISEPSDLAGE